MIDSNTNLLDENYKEKLYISLKNLSSSLDTKLDISRGKPSTEQLNLSNKLLEINNISSSNGFDLRNYGILDGLPETKQLFSDILNIPHESIIVGGNSALNMIYDNLVRLFLFDNPNGKAWKNYEKVKFLCPVPGYDRHFDILEEFGIEMINIKTYDSNKNKNKNNIDIDIDIDMIEQLVLNDDTIKGIICVPNYSNPTGITYSIETLDRLANLKTKANDFKIFCDDAYAIHHINKKNNNKKNNNYNLFRACEKFGTLDNLLYFFSTSKVTFSGAGVSIVATGMNNLNFIKEHMSKQTIGHDKINQYRTTKFLQDKQNTIIHMEKHAEILKSKFDIVLDSLEENFNGTEYLTWNSPDGGYFVCVYTEDGMADKVVKKCYEFGLILTSAGSTYPNRLDLSDNNIRIAPSYLEEEDLRIAMKIFCICVKLVSIENKK